MTNYYRCVNITLSRGEVVSPRVGTKVVLLITNPSSFNRKEIKTMIWLIYKIWLVLAFVLAIVAQKTEKDIYGVILILSTIIMFYVPFMV